MADMNGSGACLAGQFRAVLPPGIIPSRLLTKSPCHFDRGFFDTNNQEGAV